MKYKISKEENKRLTVGEYLRSTGVYDVRVGIDDEGEVTLAPARRKSKCRHLNGADVYEYLLNVLPMGDERLRNEIVRFAKKFGVEAQPTYTRVRY